MDIDYSEIEKICGKKPINVEIIDVGNNPNFVFTNDVDFEAINLYDIENNVISVNSWFECYHYVSGGWFSNLQSLSRLEEFFSYLLIFLSLGIISIYQLINIKNEKKL